MSPLYVLDVGGGKWTELKTSSPLFWKEMEEEKQDNF